MYRSRKTRKLLLVLVAFVAVIFVPHHVGVWADSYCVEFLGTNPSKIFWLAGLGVIIIPVWCAIMLWAFCLAFVKPIVNWIKK